MRARRQFVHERTEAFGIKFKSKLEARYARYLALLQRHGIISSWSYETKTFWFTPDSDGAVAQRLAGCRRGVTSYRPDFRVVNAIANVLNKGASPIEWHEVKGFMDRRSRTALARMKRYYPDERVVIIQEPDVKRLGF